MDGVQNCAVDHVDETAETERVLGLVMKAIEDDVRQAVKSLVSRSDDQLLGPGEFDLRDRVLKAACRILETTINDRKKGGIKAAACIARNVAEMRGSSSGAARK